MHPSQPITLRRASQVLWRMARGEDGPFPKATEAEREMAKRVAHRALDYLVADVEWRESWQRHRQFGLKQEANNRWSALRRVLNGIDI